MNSPSASGGCEDTIRLWKVGVIRAGASQRQGPPAARLFRRAMESNDLVFNVK
ncbi:MAG: hypothetical protein NTY37_13335 [Methanothrix sp.]|nr:hypothetical protein [Methanothrix sp.]